jgi:hypothetical protein
MRTLLLGLVGGFILLGGVVSGVAGLGLAFTHPCSPSYQFSIQSADSVSNPPEETVAFDSLSEQQQSAVEAALDEESNRWYTSQEPLDSLTDVVIVRDDSRYVAELVTNHCQSPYDEMAMAGFSVATVGFFVALFAVFTWRMT